MKLHPRVCRVELHIERGEGIGGSGMYPGLPIRQPGSDAVHSPRRVENRLYSRSRNRPGRESPRPRSGHRFSASSDGRRHCKALDAEHGVGLAKRLDTAGQKRIREFGLVSSSGPNRYSCQTTEQTAAAAEHTVDHITAFTGPLRQRDQGVGIEMDHAGPAARWPSSVWRRSRSERITRRVSTLSRGPPRPRCSAPPPRQVTAFSWRFPLPSAPIGESLQPGKHHRPGPTV